MGSYQAQLFDQEIHTVHIPEAIRHSGKATNEIIAEAIGFLHKDGIVVLENAIDTAHLDTLNALLSKEALEIVEDPDHHFNFGKETRNMDQAPPPQLNLMFKDIWCNPFAAAVLAGILGPQPVVHYANGNTALKATGRQPVHSDCEFAHPNFPFAIVVNINLVDTSAENGATEVWLGSHHRSTSDDHVIIDGEKREGQLEIKPELVEERRKHSPPIQAGTKKGSLILRDLRLWHAGMPNKTDVPRIMLAFVVQPAWFQGKSKVKLPTSVRGLVESWSDELQFDEEWVEEEVDHKKLRSTNVDFDTKSEALEKYRHELAHKPAYYPQVF
jgi:ectoine hydroxylase-related dioxygenase (phytanoyl-CoA dioxygenase family)